MAVKQTSKSLFEIYHTKKCQFEAGADFVTQRQLDGILTQANSLLDGEMVAREKRFLSKHVGSDWWELAQKQYPITKQDDGSYVVTSEAREWTDIKNWTFNYKVQAMEKVQKLVAWLYDGRVRKGVGDFDTDLAKFHEKYAA